jgi:hypothetical protein
MANPNPQHNPTDGLAVAAYVQVTGTNVVNNSGGAGAAQGTTGYALGQGIGAVASSKHPNAQYELTLSLGSKTVNGVVYSNTCQLTTVVKDVANTTYSPRIGSPVYKSYGNPVGAFYNPSNGISGNGVLGTQVAYSALTASVSAGGLVTGLHVGQTIIGVQFPVFDNTLGNEPTMGNPQEMVYAQIVCNVIP